MFFLAFACLGLMTQDLRAADGRNSPNPALQPAVVVGQAVRVGETPPVRSLAPPVRAPLAETSLTAFGSVLREIPRGDIQKNRAPFEALRAVAPIQDAVAQREHPNALMPAPLTNFEGVGNLDSVAPSDCNGDVGPNHYVEMVNLHFCVYDKTTGTNLITPMKMSQLFAAAGFPAPASTTDSGDPIVLYDHLADRWFISQFIVSVTPCHEVIAISKTGDPTGAWWLYDFTMPNNKMNDYPHFGVWPDGYYMTDNQFNPGWAGAGVFVFDRAKMLTGDTNATYQYFDLYGVDPNYGGMLPSDLDGPPPPNGTPNYFGMVDDSWVNPFDAMYIWEFHVDWTTPANSTFGASGRPNYTNAVAAFDSGFTGDRDVIPQPGTSQKLDPISDRLMHRLQYRYFGSYDSLVGCHTVDVDTNHAGVRYYQFRRNLPGGAFFVNEQATFAPDSDHRWMGSAAMDGYGNLAVGYSISGASTYPSLRYAGRLASDPSNGLYQGEATLYAGGASQTGVNRWGDYSMLAVDPADDCTFWYVNQYSAGGWNWHTRIGSFRMGSPTMGTLRGTVTNALTGQTISNALITATNSFYSTTTLTNGTYSLNMSTGSYWMVASADNYVTSAPASVTITLNSTTFQDFALSPFPLQVAPMTGLSASGNEGGPFTPTSQVYVLTNASLASLTWTALCATAWLDLSARGGTLAAGAILPVTVGFNHEADFLAAGTSTAAVVFSNVTDGGAQVRSVTLTVNPMALISADFSGGLPAGWTVIDNAGAGAEWRFDDPGSEGNLTGGSDGFAIADSDYEGTVNMDTELKTTAVDCSTLLTAEYRFKNDFKYNASEIADVDVSTNGAAGPWSNLWRRSTSVRGPTNIVLNVTAQVAGRTNVMFRFHYYNANWDWWWEVDDVLLTGTNATDNPGILPVAGLNASGSYGGPFAPDRLYRLTNATLAALTWTSLWSQAWLDVAPSNGILASGTATDVTVRVNAAADSLLPGAYADTVVFSNVTDGTTQTRAVTLTVTDALSVSPSNAFVASGLEGGPFTPGSQTNTVTNLSSHALTWTSQWSQAWLNVNPRGGTLPAAGSQDVTQSLDAASLTTPGTYTDTVIFSNLLTGLALSRAVTVTVVEITGDIRVFDSIAPTNDHLLPFGPVPIQSARTEHITVVNVHTSRNLAVNNVFFGYYQEDFSDGLAQDWHKDVEGNWTVVSGEYRAQTNGTDFMTSVYTGQQWSDCSAQVSVHRTGNTNNSEGVVLRASTNLDINSTGHCYLFVISSTKYAVFWVDGASSGALQGWTVSSAIQPGTATNVLVASAQGSALRLYINGTLVWTGTDNRFAEGCIGLAGYTAAGSQTTHYFDNVIVDQPILGGLAVGRKQTYLNSLPQPKSRPEGPDQEHSLAPQPAGEWEPDPESVQPLAAAAAARGPFIITNLPAFPATLTPGTSVTFDVIYAPTTTGSNQTIVTVANNDNDTPQVNVAVNGRATAGAIGIVPAVLHYAVTCGDPSPAAQGFVITNFGEAGFSYTSAVSYSAGAGGWFSLAAPTGYVGAGEARSHTGIVATAGLGVGVYYATGTVSSALASNSPQNLGVTLTVNKWNQTIAFPAIPGQAATSTVGLIATASSGLPVSFAVGSGPGLIGGGTNLTFTGAGVVSIVASQAGDANWNAAPNVTNSVTVYDVSTLAAPQNLAASDGTYTDKVVVTWRVVSGASGYQVWRAGENNSGSAVNLGIAIVSSYADTSSSARRGTMWYYWVKAWNSAATSEFSAVDSGFCRLSTEPEIISGQPMVGDYDGDRKADPAVYNLADGRLFAWLSSANYLLVTPVATFQAATGDLPVAGDFDGDQLADPGVFQRLTGAWYTWLSSAGYTQIGPLPFGADLNDMPIPADYDGDRLTDPAVCNAGLEWYVWLSSAGYYRIGPLTIFRVDAADIPAPGQFDADLLADPAVYQAVSGNWYVWLSSAGYFRIGPIPLGTAGDHLAVPADYDGDGLADPAAYVPSNGVWRIWESGNGYTLKELELR